MERGFRVRFFFGCFGNFCCLTAEGIADADASGQDIGQDARLAEPQLGAVSVAGAANYGQAHHQKRHLIRVQSKETVGVHFNFVFDR